MSVFTLDTGAGSNFIKLNNLKLNVEINISRHALKSIRRAISKRSAACKLTMYEKTVDFM